MSDKMVDMVLPLLKNQEYIHKVDIYNSEEIDIDLDLFRKIPMNFNLDEVRWYFQLTGIQTDLSKPYIAVEPSKKVQNKVVIMRSTRRKNIFINYKFLKKYKDLLFLGLQEEYEDLRKEVPHLEFYDCKDFLETAEIIKAGKFFLGNSSFGFTIAEGLKSGAGFIKQNVEEIRASYGGFFDDEFEFKANAASSNAMRRFSVVTQTFAGNSAAAIMGTEKSATDVLSRVSDRGIRESGMIDVSELCIKEGELVYSVYIDVAVINEDGNLFDAVAYAGTTAL